MPIPLEISPKLIHSISTLYNDCNRVIMEYIDNSLDSAEEFFDRSVNSYKRPMILTLRIEGDSYRNGKVIITDNCVGMDNIEKVVKSVGDSDKKTGMWTNGQFGYGIYSFMAACEKLEIITKNERNAAQYIPIYRKQFDAKKVEDVSFPDPKNISEFDSPSGTKVILSEFSADSWKQIDLSELQLEIEKHFELMLGRNDLKIILIDNTNKEYRCKPFDYEQYEGDHWKDEWKELVTSRIGGGKIVLEPPIKIFIKVTRGKKINKNPVFIAKGRRIGEIKDIRLFRSQHRGDLWGHPNVTGYVDVGGHLPPTIARTDFRNTPLTRALFNKLYEIEPLIHDLVDQESHKSEERHYRELEDKLNQALAKLARIDAMNFRTEYLSGRDINLQPGGSGQGLAEGFGKKDRSDDMPNDGKKDPIIGENEGDAIGPFEGIEGLIPGGKKDGDGPSNKQADNPFEDTGFKGGEKKKSGFNIKIVDHDLQIDIETNKPLRSQLIESSILIYKKPPDFQSRVDESHKKEKKITERLITYLAGEITVHYKDKFYIRHGQAEYNKNMFISVVEFIYMFEEMLKGLAGKSLSAMESKPE